MMLRHDFGVRHDNLLVVRECFKYGGQYLHLHHRCRRCRPPRQSRRPGKDGNITISTPAAKFDSEPCNASPIARPAAPITAISEVVWMPSVVDRGDDDKNHQHPVSQVRHESLENLVDFLLSASACCRVLLIMRAMMRPTMNIAIATTHLAAKLDALGLAPFPPGSSHQSALVTLANPPPPAESSCIQLRRVSRRSARLCSPGSLVVMMGSCMVLGSVVLFAKKNVSAGSARGACGSAPASCP